MKDFARDAFQSIQSSFSDIVYDNMIGELKSINDYWKVLKNAILRHIADIATKMIISGIMGTAAKKFDWLGSFMTLARMAEAFGNSVIRANYQGDTGMHVAKWIWCYNKYHKKESLKKDESWIAGIYVDAIKRLTKNEKLQEEVNEINWKLDSGEDEALNKLWKETRKLSLDALEIIYKDLNTGV